jgi:hypothetical protein
MAMIHCTFCGKESLNVDGRCQFCGHAVKVGILRRKLRKNEAYGAILIVAGIGLLQVLKIAGIFLIVGGAGLIIPGLFRQRIR